MKNSCHSCHSFNDIKPKLFMVCIDLFSLFFLFQIISVTFFPPIPIITNTTKGLAPQSGECFGAEACNPTGNPIGGGAGYNGIISETDTEVKYVVSNKDQLLTALKSAKSGDIIFVKGNANIDLSGRFSTRIPSGITLASNRGQSGSLGGRIYQTRLSGDPTSAQHLFVVGNNVQISGLRIEGPDTSTASVELLGVRNGIATGDNKGLVIDNCEIYGWSGAGISIWQSDEHPELTVIGLSSTKIGRDIAYIHHNYIHHCQADWGYGIMVTKGTALIEANLFDYTRHAITGTGTPGEGYEAQYNIHLGNTTNNIFDVHGYPGDIPGAIAGDTYWIHHNSFYSSQPSETYVKSYDVIIRGVPVQGVWIDHNSMQWYGTYLYLHPPVAQANGAGNIYMTQNLIGSAQVLYNEGPIELL